MSNRVTPLIVTPVDSSSSRPVSSASLAQRASRTFLKFFLCGSTERDITITPPLSTSAPIEESAYVTLLPFSEEQTAKFPEVMAEIQEMERKRDAKPVTRVSSPFLESSFYTPQKMFATAYDHAYSLIVEEMPEDCCSTPEPVANLPLYPSPKRSKPLASEESPICPPSSFTHTESSPFRRKERRQMLFSDLPVTTVPLYASDRAAAQAEYDEKEKYWAALRSADHPA